MTALRSPSQVLYVDDASIERHGDDWEITQRTPDVNCVWTDTMRRTTAEMIEHGPPARMTSRALDDLARSLGLDPQTVPWCQSRRTLERVVADDDSVLASIDEGEQMLTIALGVGAWKVAAALIERGERLAAPPNTVWDAHDYAIAALDESDGAAIVLAKLNARFPPTSLLLRQARVPRVVHALIHAGVAPETLERSKSTPDLPGFEGSPPLMLAVISGRLYVATALVERGASLEARDQVGNTPLMVAVSWDREASVRWLLERRANIECAPNAKGQTPRSIAREHPDYASSKLVLG
jgi:hypothetical protein